MARNVKPWMRKEPLQKSRKCGCGGNAKLFSRTNYPFGRKSKGVFTLGWKCKECSSVSLVAKGGAPGIGRR